MAQPSLPGISSRDLYLDGESTTEVMTYLLIEVSHTKDDKSGARSTIIFFFSSRSDLSALRHLSSHGTLPVERVSLQLIVV
jgi:hypothetical protein